MNTPGSGTPKATSSPVETGAEQDHDPIAVLKRHAAELRAYVQHLISAKLDSGVHAVKRSVLLAIVGLAFLGAAAVAMATAVVLTLYGVTHGLTILLDGNFWLAELIVGVSALILLSAVVLMVWRTILSKSRRATLAKYEARAHEERIHFQRDVADAAGTYLRERVLGGAGGTGESGHSSNGRGH